jgi:hypothetical protein
MALLSSRGFGFESKGGVMVNVEILDPIGKSLGFFDLARVPVKDDFILLPSGEYKVSRVALWFTGLVQVYVFALG